MKLKNKAATAIKTKSEAREKILRKAGSKAVVGAALVGGGIGLYKLAKNKNIILFHNIPLPFMI